MSTLIGAPAPFDQRSQKWSSYQTQFQHFLSVNGITDDAKKTLCLIALMGSEPQTYEILEALTFPAKPDTKSSNELFAVLTARFETKRLKIAEQYRFWKCTQGSSQPLADYMSTLRKLASTCEFPADYLPDALCTAFVLGLRDQGFSRRLLTETDLTQDKALIIAQGMETATKESLAMVNPHSSPHGEVDAVQHQHHSYNQRQPHDNQKPPPGPCPCCGSPDHWRSECLHTDATCHHCNRVGHFAKMCRSKQHTSSKQHFNNHKADPVEEAFSVLTIHDPSRQQRPSMVSTRVNGKFTQLQLDTGLEVTLINKTTWENMGQPAHHPSYVSLWSYTGTQIPTLGAVNVRVQCNGRSVKLPVIIVPGSSANLLGRSWISGLQLNLNRIYHRNNNPKPRCTQVTPPAKQTQARKGENPPTVNTINSQSHHVQPTTNCQHHTIATGHPTLNVNTGSTVPDLCSRASTSISHINIKPRAVTFSFNLVGRTVEYCHFIFNHVLML